MKTAMMTGLAALALIAGPDAGASPELAKARNCQACHSVATKLVGPAFKDIAAKYAGDSGAQARLEQKIRKGSTGTWGPVPMPANPQVSEAEARGLAQWILGLK
jgi:cytochrome c